jgi:putative transposase
MMPAKVDDLDYINFLVAAQRTFTCTEASKSRPSSSSSSPPSSSGMMDGTMTAHDSFNRLLERSFFDRDSLWDEAKRFVRLDGGVLVVDDSTLDKPYAEKIELVTRHWSGKHGRVVMGINLITTLWTDGGNKLIPCDFRVYDKPLGEDGPFGGKDKNEHMRDMLTTAKKERGLNPTYVVFDSWYTGLDNLKLIRSFGWHWFARLKSNRLVNPDDTDNVPISSIRIPSEGTVVVHLKAYGFVKVFKTVSSNGDVVDYWATNDLEMNEKDREELQDRGWGIEVYHRGIKQCCGVERSQVRKAIKQIGHITLSLRAFIRLEINRVKRGTSWYESKMSVIRGAVRAYLASPFLTLVPSA